MNNLPEVQQTRFSVAISTPKYQELIKSTLADPARVRSFTAAITSAVSVNPALQECQSPSIIAGALLGESLNLSPSPQLGQYYLVPFNTSVKDETGKKKYVKKAVFVLGYRGLLQLAIRSGCYADIDSIAIKEGEYLGKNQMSGKPMFSFIEDDIKREKLPTVGYMAYFEYLNGFKKVLYWSKEKMLEHADRYSAAFSAEAYKKLQNNEIPENERWKYSSFWYTDFDSMAKKTMLRQLISKWGVMTADCSMVQAYAGDNHVIETTNGLLMPSEGDLEPDSEPAPDEPDNMPTDNPPKKVDLSNV